MNKREIYELLTAENVDFETTEHAAVYNMEELAAVKLPYPDRDAKNLFVRDDKRRDYYLITVKGDKRVDLKEFRKRYGTRPLTFASPDELLSILELTPGSVTPFGALSDKEHKVKIYFDEDLLEGSGIIGVHPCDNTATVWLKTADLIALIKRHGSDVETVKI